ncbi:MAG: ribosomal protein S18-alanine N-acetyltransferase [Methylococcales bacterium]|nr:ribosomal protein S18-alanine N-acetyltransferase [Methylococcales bacterium]MCK5925215.1 ribosomal protein S18-alanine N-acetyltransferase [Methylococcales bacterium]
MNLLPIIKKMFSYDADREFYAKVFPDSVKLMDLARLRKMHKDDLSAVLQIEAKNYKYPWNKAIFEDCFVAMSYSCWVCEDQEKIIGYGILSVAAGEAHIINISIDPEVQGQGIGKKMMAHLIKIAKKKAETLFLEVRPSNEKAIQLYNRLGFNEVGRRKNYYPAKKGREDAVILALELVSLF